MKRKRRQILCKKRQHRPKYSEKNHQQSTHTSIRNYIFKLCKSNVCVARKEIMQMAKSKNVKNSIKRDRETKDLAT